jgi:hypothetical protein
MGFKLTLAFLFLSPLSIMAQNLIRNPNFTMIDTCPNDFGQINYVKPWQSINDQTPDLYAICGKSPYKLPIDFFCIPLPLSADDGIVGLAYWGRVSTVAEGITGWIDSLPAKEVDYYCGFNVLPNPQCISQGQPSNLCFTNSLGMNMVYKGGSEQTIAFSSKVISTPSNWTRIHGCYKKKGDEQKVSIKRIKPLGGEKYSCQVENENNFAYSYIDNLVFAPFDILPDSIVICDTKQSFFQDLSFYNLPFQWEDLKATGSGRSFVVSGTYTLTAIAGECLLKEKIKVYIVNEKGISISEKVQKCRNTSFDLVIDLPGNITWDNGSSNTSLKVVNNGRYEAQVKTGCGLTTVEFFVDNIACDQVIKVANIFRPEGKDENSRLKFSFDPRIKTTGVLKIYDRWGNVIFTTDKTADVIWDGRNQSNNIVAPGVYSWIFIDDQAKFTQQGSVMVVSQ